MKSFATMIVAALALSQASAFDGFKLDDMGKMVPLHPAAKQHVALKGQSLERFQSVKTPIVSGKDDPTLTKLVKEKAELAVKLAAVEPARKLAPTDLKSLHSFQERLGELKKIPEGAKLLEKMTARLEKNPHENVDSFLNLLFKLKNSLTDASKNSKKTWGTVKATCDESEGAGKKKVAELAAREQEAKRSLTSIRAKMARTNAELAKLRAKTHGESKSKPTQAIAMVEVMQHNVVNHIPRKGSPMIKRSTLDVLAEHVATVDPGTFRLVDRSINALLEIAAPVGQDEEVYCPENFCQKSKKRDPEFHGPRSAFVECYKPETKETRMPTIWTPSKGAKRRAAMLNAGMHRQSCTVEGTAPKSNKQKVYGILQRLRTALSGATPAAAMEGAKKQLEASYKHEKAENEKLTAQGAQDALKPEIARLEAEIDGLLSDEAAAEATEQNYHMLLTAERKFKLDLVTACEAKAKRQIDEQRARKAQVAAVDMAVLLVKKNLHGLKHFLKGGSPMSAEQLRAMNDESELMLDPDMAAAKALEEVKVRQRNRAISKGVNAVEADGVDPSLVKLEEISLKKGCVAGKELWCGTKKACISRDDECPSAPIIMKDENGNQVVTQGGKAAFVFEDPIDNAREKDELEIVREKATMLKKKAAQKKANELLRKRYEEKIKSINKRKEELQKSAEADQKRLLKIAAQYKIADKKATKLEMNVKNMKLDIMSYKDDLERYEKECAKYEAKADRMANETNAVEIESRATITLDNRAAMASAEKLIEEEDDIHALRANVNEKTKTAREASGNVTEATQAVADATARYGDLAAGVAASAKMPALLEMNSRNKLRGGYGGDWAGEQLQAKAVASAEKEKSYLLDSRLQETEAKKVLAVKSEEMTKAGERLAKGITVGKVLKAKQEKAKAGAEAAKAAATKRVAMLENEGKIALNQFKSCRRDRNAVSVKISDDELKLAQTERDAAEARTYAETLRQSLGKAKVQERADEMEAAIVSEPLPEQSPIVSVACGLYISASECVTNAACGWIPTVGCRTGAKSGPYFWDGELPGWQYRKLDNAKCELYSDCRQCIDSGCGWCGARLSCTAGTQYGPDDLEACPAEYMPQWAHKLGRSRNACPVRQVVETESSMAQQFALRVALATRQDMARKESDLEVKANELEKMNALGNSTDSRNLAQEVRGLRSEYETLKAQLKDNVAELRHAELGKARTYQAGYAEGLKLAERKFAHEKGYLEGLKTGIAKAKNMRGPAGEQGPAGPAGTPGKNVESEKLRAEIEKHVKALADAEKDKAARNAEEAVKAAQKEGNKLDSIASQEMGITGGASGMTGMTGNSATGLDSAREQEVKKLDDAKIKAKAAISIASLEGAPATDAAANQVDEAGNTPAAQAAKEKGQALAVQKAVVAGPTAGGKKEPAETGIAITAEDEENQDEDMEARAAAEKEGMKAGELSETEKAAMEANRKATQAKVKQFEDAWKVQVDKLNNAIANEKLECQAATDAKMAATALEARKKKLNDDLVKKEKGEAKARENAATLTEDVVKKTEKENVAKEKLEDANKIMAAGSQVKTDEEFKLNEQRVAKAQSDYAGAKTTKEALAADKKAAQQDASTAKLAIASLKSLVNRVDKDLIAKTEEAELKSEKKCPSARKVRAVEEAEAGKLEAEYKRVKFGLEKAQAMMEKKMTAGVRNMSFALSVKSGPYVSAGAKGFNALKSKLKGDFSVEFWVKLRSFAPAGTNMVGIVSALSSRKGFVVGANQDGFVFGYRRMEGAAVKEMEYVQSTDPTADDDKDAGVKIETGKWYHVAALFSSKQVRLYVNGKLANFKSFAPSSLVIDAPRGDLLVGSSSTKNGGSDAVIDDVAIWSRELKKEELNSHSCAAKGMKKEMENSSDESLVLYYNFGPNNVPGLNVFDKSKNGLDGKIFAPANSKVTWVPDSKEVLICKGPARIGKSRSLRR